MEDVWTGPAKEEGGCEIYIKWRVEGTDGLATGTIGWPDYPSGSPSTLKYAAKSTKGEWINPSWDSRWFPQAFKGVMEQLQYALDTGTVPELTGDIVEVAGVLLEDPGWRDEMKAAGESRSQGFARRLIGDGCHGLMVRSFAAGTTEDDINLVLWRWSEAAPHRLILIDDENRLSP